MKLLVRKSKSFPICLEIKDMMDNNNYAICLNNVSSMKTKDVYHV